MVARRGSLVALRRRLSPALPLSHAHRRVGDPAVVRRWVVCSSGEGERCEVLHDFGAPCDFPRCASVQGNHDASVAGAPQLVARCDGTVQHNSLVRRLFQPPSRSQARRDARHGLPDEWASCTSRTGRGAVARAPPVIRVTIASSRRRGPGGKAAGGSPSAARGCRALATPPCGAGPRAVVSPPQERGSRPRASRR